jgi:HK97 family phage prohead protease
MKRNDTSKDTPVDEALVDDLDGLARSLSVKEREAIPLEDFAWPEERKFPIDSQEHLESAAHLIGKAPRDMREKIKTRAIEIAKRKGFTLPDAWQESPKEDRSMLPETLTFYVPIDRIDPATREVVGVATAEVEDGHGTVFRYEGSKDAFTRWRGNIREMHDPHKAVGRALEVVPDDAGKKIIVRARISAGAEDTWQKVLDGTLTGFSVGGRNGKWGEIDLGGRKVPCLERYDLSELSLVDNPSNPEATISIVRADGIASEVLAVDEAAPSQALHGGDTEGRNAEATETRKGARISVDTQRSLHDARNHALQSAMKMMKTCNCDDCKAAASVLDPDGDGDIDLCGLDDPDGDSKEAMAHNGSDDRADLVASIVRQLAPALTQELAKELRGQLGPTTSRVNALLARTALRAETPDITRRVDALDENVTKVLDLVEKIAAQPQGGGPVLAVDKRLATQPGTQRTFDDTAAIQRALELGFAPPDGQEAQTRAAAALIAQMRR